MTQDTTTQGHTPGLCCDILVNIDGRNPAIAYCPLHAAAPDLLGVLEQVADEWCQMASFCYEAGDIRVGSQGCVHVRARILRDRISGVNSPEPVYFNPREVQP